MKLRTKVVAATTLLLPVLLAGCATPPPLTREEYLATVSRTYADVTPDQIFSATEKLMRLADGDDFQITHHAEGLRATRNWLAYAVIAMANGTDYWDVKATSSNAGTKVEVQVSTQSAGTSVVAGGRGTYAPLTTVSPGNPVMGTAIYDLFFARLEFLLGKRADWMSCAAADDRVKKKIVWGDNSPLCNSFNVNDDTPAGVPVTARKTRRPYAGSPPF